MEISEYKNIEIFKNNLSTFKETSYDKDGKTPGYMTDSEMQVINYDKVKGDYIKGMSLSNAPCSNDALYIGEDKKLFFVEFKNGVMTNRVIYNVHYKIYDSLLMFNDIVNENISFCRQNVYFVLVYNENRNSFSSEGRKQEDSSKAIISKFVHKKANKKFVRFGLERFEKMYFKEVFTYTESEFEKEFLPKIAALYNEAEAQ